VVERFGILCHHKGNINNAQSYLTSGSQVSMKTLLPLIVHKIS
jgi:hypothetical protein